MAHLDLKVRLKDAQHAAELKQHFENKGSTLFFSGTENDKIYYGHDGAMVKHRHAKGLGNSTWAENPESDEITGLGDKTDLVPMDQSWAIHYKQVPVGLPSPHYLVKVTNPVLNGIGKNIYTDKSLYAEVQKEREVYWLTQKEEAQGSLPSNLRIHLDTIILDKPYHFLEIETKFSNHYSQADIRQAQKDLTALKEELNIKPVDIVSFSYGKLARNAVMHNNNIHNEWIDAIPFSLLHEFAYSKEKVFDADAVLMSENDLNDGAYVILDGKVRVLYQGQQFDHSHGKIVGELATYNKTDRRCATVTAVAQTNTLHLHKELVSELCGCDNVLNGWLKRYAPQGPQPIRA